MLLLCGVNFVLCALVVAQVLIEGCRVLMVLLGFGESAVEGTSAAGGLRLGVLEASVNLAEGVALESVWLVLVLKDDGCTLSQ